MIQSNGIKVGYVVPNSSGGGAGSSSQAGGCCSWVVAASHTIAQGSPCSILMFAYSWPWMICSFSHHVSIHEETIFSVSCRFNLCNLSVKPIIHDYYPMCLLYPNWNQFYGIHLFKMYICFSGKSCSFPATLPLRWNLAVLIATTQGIDLAGQSLPDCITGFCKGNYSFIHDYYCPMGCVFCSQTVIGFIIVFSFVKNVNMLVWPVLILCCLSLWQSLLFSLINIRYKAFSVFFFKSRVMLMATGQSPWLHHWILTRIFNENKDHDICISFRIATSMAD
jgi:hypothetical protein